MDFYYSHARTALKYGLRALGVVPGEELLLPALICDVVIHPLEELGIVPRYYPVLPSLQPDWTTLAELLTEKSRSFLLVHFFGQPQDLEMAGVFCRSHGISLIEDNAHGYGGSFKGKPLGSFGDFGISSPRKTFGWRNGGVLHWNRETLSSSPLLPEQPGGWIWRSRSLVKKILFSVEGGHKFFRNMPDYSSQEVGRESPIPSWGMDPKLAMKMNSKKLDLERMISRRRALWELWRGWAISNGLMPIYETLDPGANPLAFPVRTRTPEESRQWFRWGWNRGLYVHSWPALPRHVVDNDPLTLSQWSTMVCFPIGPDMTPEFLISRLGL